MSISVELSVALDAARLMRAAGLVPDAWQEELLHSEAGRVLLCCCRQSGKSTVTAALALHEALYRDGSLVLMLAPALRQSQELFRKVVGFYRALEHPVAAEAESALRLELANGSRVVSLPGREETVRGYSGVRLLVVDEAARVPDELYYAVRPMLAVSAGRMIALSTPFGKRGWFYEAWANGGPAWERIHLPAERCPRIAGAFLEEERRALGPWWFGQEYECRFLETTAQVFATADVEGAIDWELEPLFPDFR
jgi:hypothetical protein